MTDSRTDGPLFDSMDPFSSADQSADQYDAEALAQYAAQYQANYGIPLDQEAMDQFAVIYEAQTGAPYTEQAHDYYVAWYCSEHGLPVPAPRPVEPLAPPTPPEAGPVNLNVPARGKSSLVRAVIVIAILLAGVATGGYVWMGQKKEIEQHIAVREAFDAAHQKAYLSLWKKIGIESRGIEDSKAFSAELLSSIRKAPQGYSYKLKDKGLPAFDAGLAAFQAIKAPAVYADELQAVIDAYSAARAGMAKLSDKLLLIDGFLSDEAKLTKMDNAWFNAQTWADKKYYTEAFKFYKMLRCVLEGQSIAAMAPLDLGPAVEKLCGESSENPAWFERVAFECYSMLSAKDEEANQEFKDTLAAFAKKVGKKQTGKLDETSGAALKTCIKESRTKYEISLARTFASSFEGYAKARKDFIAANASAQGQQK